MKLILGHIPQENLVDKSFQIQIPQIGGHFIIQKGPLVSNEPGLISISYFKEKPDLSSYIQGHPKADLEMVLESICNSDFQERNPFRVKHIHAHGNALELFDTVFKREPKNITNSSHKS